MPKTKEIEEDLIENKYNAGSLVWGRVDDHPWWPAIVDDCPETLQFYELEGRSIIPVSFRKCKYINVIETFFLTYNIHIHVINSNIYFVCYILFSIIVHIFL